MKINYSDLPRLTRSEHAKVELPPCACGKTPKTKIRTSHSDWGHNEVQWIQCECGMRTVEKDYVYNRNENLQLLINIWNDWKDYETI